MNLKRDFFLCFISLLLSFIFLNGNSQDNNPGKFTTGADIYSSYIWRGTKYGTGPAIQPNIKFSSGAFTAGAWGSFDFNGYQEADIYFSFSLPAGFTLGMTDYYYPGLRYFDYSSATGSHAFEINLGFSKWNLNLSANYMINEAGDAGTKGGDKYFEAKYSVNSMYLFLGAGDGWHSTNKPDGSDKFTICNFGLGVTRSITVSNSFNIPVNGQIVFNPDSEQMFIVAGFTF